MPVLCVVILLKCFYSTKVLFLVRLFSFRAAVPSSGWQSPNQAWIKCNCMKRSTIWNVYTLSVIYFKKKSCGCWEVRNACCDQRDGIHQFWVHHSLQLKNPRGTGRPSWMAESFLAEICPGNVQRCSSAVFRWSEVWSGCWEMKFFKILSDRESTWAPWTYVDNGKTCSRRYCAWKAKSLKQDGKISSVTFA